MRLNRQFGTFRILILWLALVLSACSSDSDHSTSGITSGGEEMGRVEDRYSDRGPYTPSSTHVDDFTLFFPSHLEGDHPIVTWGNGTMAPTLVYSAFLNHLASWGFVVVASDSVLTLSGDDLIAGIDYLIEQNETATSDFYGMLDTDHIATVGHSQGGSGAINAARDARVTCSVPITPAPGAIRQVEGPVFLIAGSEDKIIPAAWVRSTCYDPATGPTVFAVAQGMGHMSFSGDAGGYITAWLMYHLQDDQYAGHGFMGECEICATGHWEVEMKNFP